MTPVDDHAMNPDATLAIADLRRHVDGLSWRVKSMENSVDRLSHTIENKLVTQIEFSPVKLMVYGMVGIILTAVIAALVATVVSR